MQGFISFYVVHYTSYMKSWLNNPVVYLFHKMYSYAGERKKNIIFVTISFVVANLSYLTQPLIIGYFLDFIQKNGISRDNIYYLFAILLVYLSSEIVFWIFWGPARIVEQKTSFLIKKNYKEYLLSGTMSLPLSWHTDHHSGDTIDKIEKGTIAMGTFSENSFNFIQAFVRLFVSILTLLYFNLYSTLVVVIMSGITFYILFLYDKRLVPGYAIVNKLENNIAARIYDTISNITTVIILRVESLVLKSISKTIDLPYPQYRKNSINNELKWFWASILGQISVVLSICVYLVYNLQTGDVILVGSIYILYSYNQRIKDTFYSFAQLYNDAVKWRSNIMNTEELSENFTSDNATFEKKHLPKRWSTLSIKNLSFSYHDEENADLHLGDVSIDIKKGEKIAVIGESGGGKTTFLKIFRGLYEPKTITLEIDDKEVTHSFDMISDSISLIPQDPEIFATTIRENITLGVEYSDAEIKHFIDMASFTEVVERLPSKLESTIVEKGVNLSGGEKQRLALARGLLASKNKDIVLLDEPTSSVDFHNELKIYENIFANFPEKTIISSIHRLHLLSLFDTILFFKDGKIVARGNLEHLKQNSKDFQDLWDKYIQTQNQ